MPSCMYVVGRNHVIGNLLENQTCYPNKEMNKKTILNIKKPIIKVFLLFTHITQNTLQI